MSWIGKWKELKEKQRKKDIEYCKQHPMGWKIIMGVFAFLYLAAVVFLIVGGAYLLAIIATVFAICLEREHFRVYKAAFPKIDQAFTGLE